MTVKLKISRIREYRSRLANDLRDQIDVFMASGRSQEDYKAFADKVDVMNRRIRISSLELQRLQDLVDIYPDPDSAYEGQEQEWTRSKSGALVHSSSY